MLNARPPEPGRDARAVGPAIRAMLPSLSELESRLVEHMLADRGFSERTALRQVAQLIGVSDAMVVKLAKKLGYAGFRDMRRGIVAYNRLPTAELHQQLDPEDDAPTSVGKVFRTAIQALEETLAILDMRAFARAAEALGNARQRDFYGVGGSAQIARDVAHKFLRIGVRASVFDDAHMMLMSAALLGPGDVAVGFSHSGETHAVIDPVALAGARGATTIVITNHALSRLAQQADIVLASTAQGSPLTSENAAARIAQLNILDALFVAVAQQDIGRTEANLARTMEAVDPKRRRA
ncbi:MAG: MurR/RpiR family transcriptional regulator [Acetobacteraceae bacterium]|nr:MurR/RpiR family transcriptional regulator [Acetobacteraceae bacterium]